MSDILDLWSLRIMPPWLNTRSTGALDAGTLIPLAAGITNLARVCRWACQKDTQQSKWCTIAVTVNGYQYLSLKYQYQYQYQYKYTVLQPWYLAYISMRLQHARQRSVPRGAVRCLALRCAALPDPLWTWLEMAVFRPSYLRTSRRVIKPTNVCLDKRFISLCCE